MALGRCGVAPNSDAAFPARLVAAEAAPTASLRDLHRKTSTSCLSAAGTPIKCPEGPARDQGRH